MMNIRMLPYNGAFVFSPPPGGPAADVGGGGGCRVGGG